MALIYLVNNIASSMDNKETTAGVLLDLSKAFDTINHHILPNKLDLYGIRGHSLDQAFSYLTNRKQLAKVTSPVLNRKQLYVVVPKDQLEPLLFIIYINDLHKASNLLKTDC